MKSKKIKRGRVVTPADANPWSHEQKVAKILALAGHYVEFIPETNLKTPDIYLDNTIYEIKSPITDNPKKIIRNVKRALEKSPNVIIDSSRVKGLSDEAIQRTLKSKVKDLPGLRNLLFINKRGQIMSITFDYVTFLKQNYFMKMSLSLPFYDDVNNGLYCLAS